MSGRLSNLPWLAAALLVLAPSSAFAQTAEIQKLLEVKLKEARKVAAQRVVQPPAQAPAPLPAAVIPAKTEAAPRDDKADAKALAKRIDQIINARLAAGGVRPAPRAEDAGFFRRLNLDVNGRIPPLLDVRDFLDDDRSDKRAIWLEQMLEGEAYAKHFAHVWRSLMLRENNNFQLQFLQGGFEAWLKGHLQKNTGYDKMVRELLTAGQQQVGQPVFGQPGVAGPGAFYTANENKPENLAATTSRVFLGVKLECAQCHPHPFAKWTRNQFWEYAAFFNGIQGQRGVRGGVPVQPVSLGREIQIAGTDKVVKAKFLDGVEPKWQDGTNPRQAVADWMTAPENPFFARAAVDHVWAYFFGVSLLEPIMEVTEEGPPTHPELLDLLARQFRAHGYDLKFLIRTIAQTEAYQRASGGPSANKEDVLLFARMPVRGMSPEQLFDSVSEATDYHATPAPVQQQFNFNGQQTPRAEFISKFAGLDKRIESQTSILQALFLMHGKFMAERTRLDKNKSLQTIATAPTTTARRVETLYLLALSRLPRPEESERLIRYIDSGGAMHDPHQALADVYWALLNSGEFCLNH